MFELPKILRMCKWFGPLIFLCSCSGHLYMSPPARGRLSQSLEGGTYYLKQSLFAGPFYDDDRYLLVHPRPFGELTYVKTPDNETIYPPDATAIVPYGARVEVERIEWPTGFNVIKRPLYTPRFSTWIYLKGDSKKRLILLPPGGISDEAGFSAWFETIFSANETKDWLASRSESVQKAIREKRVELGMDSAELEASWGQPDSIKRELQDEQDKRNTKEVAQYAKRSITLVDGVVKEISPSS